MIRLLGLLTLLCAVFTSQAQSTVNIVEQVAWNSDGTLLAWSAYLGQMHVFDVRTNTPLYTRATPNGRFLLAWHPQEPHLLAVLDITPASNVPNEVYLIEVSTSTILHRFEVQNVVTGMAWNHDGTLLTTGTQNERFAMERDTFIVWDYQAETSKEVNLEIGISFTLGGFEWSPIDNRIVTLYVDNREAYLVTWDVDREVELNTFTVETTEGLIQDFVWSPNGTQIALGVRTLSGEGEIWLFDPNVQQLIRRIPTLRRPTPVWHPYEHSLTFTDRDQIRILDLTTNTETTIPLSEGASINDMAWSPHGGRLAVAIGGRDGIDPQIAHAVDQFADGLVQIVVPTPSEELIETIAARCEITVIPALAELARRVPTTGCEAELRDVARALIALVE
jgi:WD40 repeat protein